MSESNLLSGNTENSQQNTQVVNAQPVVSQTAPQGSVNVPQGSVQQNAQNQVAPAKEWWETDPRMGKVWKSKDDFVGLYKSADEILENKYKPAYKQYESLTSKLKSAGLDAEKIDDYIKEYGDLKSPDRPESKLFKYLSELADDDLSAEELQVAIAKIEEGKLARKYPGVNAEQRQRIIANDKKLAELEKWKQTIDTKEKEKEITSTMQNSLQSIDKLAQQKGFELTNEMKIAFLDKCAKEGIDPKYLLAEFRNQYETELDKAYEQKLKAGSLKAQDIKNKTTIPLKAKDIPQAKPKTLEEKLFGLIGKNK